MAKGSPVLQLRVPAAKRERWEELAAQVGAASLPDLIRDTMDALVAGELVPAAESKRRGASPREQVAKAGERVAVRAGARRDYCPHRRRPDEFCARCDA